MNTKKKILVIAGGGYISGAEKVTLNAIKGFKEHGHEVHCMVSGWNDGDFINRLKEMNIAYTAIKLGWYYTSKLIWSLDSLVHYPKAIRDFLKLKKKFKADIVYLISFRQIVLLYPFFKSNVFYHVHDPNSHSRQSKFFLARTNPKVKKYIAVSEFVKQDLVASGINATKINIVHNGIELPEKDLGNKIYMPENILRIGIIGQVIPRKGHEDVIEALNKLQTEINFSLRIFGTGPGEFESELKKKINLYNLDEKVNWMGFVENQKEIYSELDLLLAPTRNEEPFALVALEAGASAIPSIVTKSGGFSESIIDGETGYLIDKENPEQLAEKIKLFYKQPHLLKEMGLLARKRVNEKFNIREMNKKLNDIIENN